MGIVTLLGLIALEIVITIFALSISRSRTSTPEANRAFVFFLTNLGVWAALNYLGNLAFALD
ncbi:MAG TPA: hypothetical protein VFM68_04075, partial [Candidatus Saccharimonadales bacterium]|nr:hypothetical protein [Candidatus Saccharimonadales bacterium]